MSKSFEDKLDELLMMQAEQCAKEQSEIGDEEVVENATSVLNRFCEYIKSFKFKFKCKKISLKTGVSSDIIQNNFVKSVLGKIADVLGIVINFAGNVIKCATSFIANVITNVANFTCNVLLKIVNIITLNCGSLAY